MQSRTRIRDNVLAGGRRDVDQIHDHARKIEAYDSLFTKNMDSSSVPLLVDLNKQFEDALIREVNTRRYPMRIPIPLKAQIDKHKNTRLWDGGTYSSSLLQSFANLFSNTEYYNAGIYEAFYYGKNASTITGIDQTSIFFGTPNPIDNTIDQVWDYTDNNSLQSL